MTQRQKADQNQIHAGFYPLRLGRKWNLRMTNPRLMDEFIREIKVLRKIQKIRISHGNTGKKPRGVSWKLVEVLDRKQNGIGKFGDSERHTLSEARKGAEKYCLQNKRALAEWHKGAANAESDIEKPDGDYGTSYAF